MSLCHSSQKPWLKLASGTVKHKPCSHFWKHFVYHGESTVYNIISLWRHEQIRLMRLRFGRYFSWDVASLNICSWRDQVIILGTLKRKAKIFLCISRVYNLLYTKIKQEYTLSTMVFAKKNKFLLIEVNSIHSFYWKVRLITRCCSSFLTLF